MREAEAQARRERSEQRAERLARAEAKLLEKDTLLAERATEAEMLLASLAAKDVQLECLRLHAVCPAPHQ